MFFALAVLFAMEVAGSFGLPGQGAGPPDVKGFTPVMSKELEFRIDDYKTALVGRIIVYQNPNDLNEFVRVYYRQVAIISERAQTANAPETGSRDTNLSNLKYHNQQESEALSRVQKSMDAFAYVQWQIVRDPRTRQDVRSDFLRSWLLEQDGNWASSYGYDLLTSPFSEPSKADPKKRIIVGLRFVLAGEVHIIRIDQDDILNLVEKEETTNDKK